MFCVTSLTDLTSNSFTGNFGYLQGFSPGTQISAGFQNQYQDQNASRNLFKPYSLSSLGVTVTQPLLRGFGTEMNQRFIHIAKNSEKISDYVFQQQVISTVSGVIRLYDDLVSLNRRSAVKQETLATAQRLLEDNKNKVDQGTLAPIEATRAEAQVAAAAAGPDQCRGLRPAAGTDSEERAHAATGATIRPFTTRASFPPTLWLSSLCPPRPPPRSSPSRCRTAPNIRPRNCS